MSLDTRHDLIFGHEGNARAAASLILIGVLAVLIGSVFMAIGPKFKQDLRPTREAYIGGTAAPIRMIGHAPREKESCEEQVWPNIDQRCLVRAKATANSGNTSSPWQNDNLSPPSPTAITTMNHQSSLQGATNGGNYAAAPTPLEQDALNVTEPSDATVGPFDDNASELREPIEPPRKRARRHSKPFHLHFGGFRF